MKIKHKALFTGTFDPFTKGHQNIVERSLNLMDEVVIGIGVNDSKRCLFSLEKRLQMITKLYENEPRVKVATYQGLTADFAKEINATCIVRGLRCVKDFRQRFPGERIAALAVNGVTAMDVLCAMQQTGITPGYDFGFCTFDDWSWFSLISPGITAVRMETKQLGARAAELLLERLRGEREDDAPAVNVELPTTFMERGSLMRQLP